MKFFRNYFIRHRVTLSASGLNIRLVDVTVNIYFTIISRDCESYLLSL